MNLSRSATGPDGIELNIVESWPLDGDRSRGTAFIGAFVDEAGNFFTIECGEVSEAGGTLSFRQRDLRRIRARTITPRIVLLLGVIISGVALGGPRRSLSARGSAPMPRWWPSSQ